MATRKTKAITHVQPLFMNGLQGRMLHLPAPRGKTKEILLVYGHFASLERYVGLARALSRYGAVTMPDLPGFGGMQSFYKIGMVPTLDNLADYLAAFIKLRYKHRRITIVGVSFGFIVATKMLQKYPQIASKVNLLVSLTGFVHKDDFVFSRQRYYALQYASALSSHRLPAWFMHSVLLRPNLVRLAYRLRGLDQASDEAQFKIGLWRSNDTQTYMKTAHEMLTLDLCKHHVDLPVYHVAAAWDHYFDNHIVEQHMRVVFSDFTLIPSKRTKHALPMLARAKDVAQLLPPKLRELLRSS